MNPKYTKKIKDFADYKEPDRTKVSPNLEVSGGVEALLPNARLSDMAAKSARGGDVSIETPQYSSRSVLDPSYTASYFRDKMGEKISEEMAANNVNPREQLPNPSENFFIDEAPLRELKGAYLTDRGGVVLNSELADKEKQMVLAHELGHKKSAQERLVEGRIDDPMSLEQWTIAPRSEMSMPYTKNTNVKDLVNYGYRRHHRSDAENAWEIEALKNLQSKGTLSEPNTPDISPKYKAWIKEKGGNK